VSRQEAETVVRIEISLTGQWLRAFDATGSVVQWPVSSATSGAGEQEGSGCTPRGRHRIRAKIGAGLPVGAVLVGRRWTGEQYSEQLAAQYPERDWVLTRILWLCGCEPGRNRLGRVDTQKRYIYIHGTPDTNPVGVPGSHGCIRMRNADLVALFDRVTTDTEVEIYE
jgi:lipoprotein-anchoring transpeptidase ErfK/SrfK